MSPSQNFTLNESQKCWAAFIKDRCRYFFSEEYHSSVPDIQRCVFKVPKRLSGTKPDAYSPQNVGLGPYHHCRPQLKLTTDQKLEALKNHLKINDVEDFIGRVEKCSPSFGQMTRSYYDGHLDLDGKSLAWIVIIDSIFLLHSIQTDSREQEHSEHHDAASSNELFVRDLLMLENQIPFGLIRKMQPKFRIYSLSIPSRKIVDFCCEHSPFPVTTDGYSVDEVFLKSNHMLDIMHQLILGREIDELSKEVDSEVGNPNESDHAAKVKYREHLRGLMQHAVSQGIELKNIVIDGLLSAYKEAKKKRVEMPGILDNLSMFAESLKSSSSSDVKKRHLPSVSQLYRVAQITFTPLPRGFGLRAVTFEGKNNTLYLPVMKLSTNSEVILRNLMAYEAKSSERGSEVTDFVEFMCKIIKDQNDVTILKSANIIEGEMRPEEIVLLSNNLKKAVENTDRKKSDSFLDAIADNLIKIFKNERLVKACGRINNCVVAFFKILKPLFPILVVLLLFFQSICEISDCRRGRLSVGPLGELGPGDGHPSGKASVLSLETHAELMPARKLLRY